MLVAIRENVATLKKQGRSLAGTIAAKPAVTATTPNGVSS